MKRPRWNPIAALFLFALLLTGCINIQQEYWLYEDGSAKVSMDIGMAQALLSLDGSNGSSTTTNAIENLKTEFNSSNPNIKNVQIREYTDNDLQHFAVTFDAPDFKKFLANQTSQDSEFHITLTNTPDESILFKQITQLDTGIQNTGMDAETMGAVFKDMFWTVTVHVPRVISTNGQQLDGNTVQWKIPIADIFTGKAPGELTMVYRPQGSLGGSIFGIWLVAGIVLLGIAVGAAYIFLVYRRRPAAVPAVSAPAPSAEGFTPEGGFLAQGSAAPAWDEQPSQPRIPLEDGTPETDPQQQPPQPPPPQSAQTPLSAPPPPAEPPQQPDYPAFPQYTQAPQNPPGPVQGGDYYPSYYPPQPPPEKPSPDQSDQR